MIRYRAVRITPFRLDYHMNDKSTLHDAECFSPDKIDTIRIPGDHADATSPLGELLCAGHKERQGPAHLIAHFPKPRGSQ